MPRDASANRACASARPTASRIPGGQTATKRTRPAEACTITCTRLPLLVKVARCEFDLGSRNLRSMRRASADRRARRSVPASRQPSRACAFFARMAFGCTGAEAHRPSCSERCAALDLRPGRSFFDLSGAELFVPEAQWSAEYHACESARRSIAASGAASTQTLSSCVIMHVSSQRRLTRP